MQYSLISRAITLLKKGELVAFPTDTVYGLGALATHPAAIQKLFQVKQRPITKPCSLLIPDATYLVDWVREVNEPIQRLAQAFWPGPLTILCRPSERVLTSLSANSNRIGIRVPRHPIALSLLKGVNTAIAAPSANLSNRWSATQAEIVRYQLGNKIPLILEGEGCLIGIESTVIDMTAALPKIVRLGAVTQVALEQALGTVIIKNTPDDELNKDEDSRMQWVNVQDLPYSSSIPEKTALLAYSPQKAIYRASIQCTWIAMPNQPLSYQYAIYEKLYTLKKQGYSTIWIEILPNTSEWAPLISILNRWCH
jgi:L-threonylcarbamoyladenylate synthase